MSSLNESKNPNLDRPQTSAIRGLEIGKYYAAARERVWMFIAVAGVISLAITAFMLALPPLYKAETTIQLLREGERQLQFVEITEEKLENSEDLNTEVDFYESDQILERVAVRIRNEIATDFLAPYELDPNSVSTENLMNIIEENRNVLPSRLSLVVVIEYLHEDPKVAATVANFFHEEISAANIERRSEIMNRAIQELRAQADIQQLKVENLEREIHSFKNKHKTISFDQGFNIDREELSILNTNATNTKEVLDRLYAKWSMVENQIEKESSLLQLPFLTDDENIRDLSASISKFRIEMAELTQRYRKLHPKMIQARESMAAAESELESALNTQVEMLRSELKQGERNYHSSVAKANKKKQEILELQGMQSNYDSKMRDLEVNKSLYLQFFGRIQEIEAQNRGQTSRIRIVDEARPPRELAQPKLKAGLMLAVFAGSIMGVIAVVLSILADNRIKGPSDIEKGLSLPIIGLLGKRNRDVDSLVNLVKENAKDPGVSESLNSIVDSIRLGSASSDSKVILFTSTSHREGKSYVASSIASAFKRYGEKTLLLDCDLRTPTQVQSSNEAQGLLTYLENTDKNIDDCIQRSPALECDVMPAGGVNIHPYRLIDSHRFQSLIAELRKRYDRIILDTPPTHLYGDARNLAKHADGQILVVGFGVPKLENAIKSVAKLQTLGTPLFGAIVNAIDSKNAKVYYPEFHSDQRSYLSFDESSSNGISVSIRSIASRIMRKLPRPGSSHS